MSPVVASTRHSRLSLDQQGYDCVSILVVREGSVILTSDHMQHPIAQGDAVLVAPQTPMSYAPEGLAATTTLLIDTDYLVEHLFWQNLDVIPDREAARELATRLFPEPVQVLRLGERQLERLGPLFDELVTLTSQERSASSYFHAHALVLTILAVLAPLVRHAPVAVSPLTSRQRAIRVASPRWRAFQPVRQEIARTAVLMQDDIARRWSISELAAHACLSPHRYTQVFKESYGVTPFTYLSVLRVQEMARLIRETDLLIGTITERVGWCHRSGHAICVFRRYMGVTPSRYRHYGPPTASREGPGVGVSRATETTMELL